jgi:protein KTI12
LPVDELLKRNSNREDGKKYSEATVQALLARYEAPDSRNRWDSPLVVVHNNHIPFEEIDNALFKRNAPPPNMSTQSQPLADTNYLHILDNKTRDIINLVTKSQEMGQVTDIVVPDSRFKLSLNRELTAAQLNKLRRQFITFTKMHPVDSEAQIATTFVQYLNSNTAE